MPAPIAAGDRKILLIAGAVLVVLTAGLAFLGGDPKEQGTPIPSTYSANPGGARAAYLLLQDLHYKVSRWERSPTELSINNGLAVLILADPLEIPTKQEIAALRKFVEKGGQVIFTGARIKLFFPEARLDEEFSTDEWKTFSANFPSNYTAGAPKIVLQTGATWQAPDASQLALYGDTQSPVVVSWRIGDGRILWWAAATPLTNSGISSEGNLNLFLNAMNFPVRAKQFTVHIYWDEYFHGERTSLWSYVRKTPVTWGLVQISCPGIGRAFYVWPAERPDRASTCCLAARSAGIRGHARRTVRARGSRAGGGGLCLPAIPCDSFEAVADLLKCGRYGTRGRGASPPGLERNKLEADSGARVSGQPGPEGRAGGSARLGPGTGTLRRAAWLEEENCKGEILNVENITRLAAHVRTEMSKVIVGQQEIIDQLLLVLICGGHALIEGVPGLAKTLAVKTLARICGLGFQRVQCTADLMPADVMGTNIFNMATSSFSLHRGPVFTDLLLVDEINRTSPRTQAALLEAMEERQVTIDGTRYPLGENFTVFATQNPIEFEGTYPLPEAQLDRFLLKIRLDYPSAAEESRYPWAVRTGIRSAAAGSCFDCARRAGIACGRAARYQRRAHRADVASLHRYVGAAHARLAGPFAWRQPARRDRTSICCASLGRHRRPRFPHSRRHQDGCLAGSAPPCSPQARSGAGRLEFRPSHRGTPFHGRGSQVIYTEPLGPTSVTARARKQGRLSFAFGPRFFVALLLGFVALGPAWWFRQAIAVMFLWDGVVVAAWLWDLLRLPRPAQLEVRRTWEKRPCLGVAGSVAVGIQNDGNISIRARVVDETPAQFRSAPPDLAVDRKGALLRRGAAIR